VARVLDYTLVLDENSNIRAMFHKPLCYFWRIIMTQRTTSSAALAAAAALIALSGAAFAAESPKGSMGAAISASDKVHCYGVNSCKGTADCKTAEHACKGQNSCKGQGFQAKDAKSCLSKGGTIGDIDGAK
jgi:uncharacterized membrane protein